ncbi:MAG: dephospho-CoA kinase [Pseudomonadota bacterium]|nr:dephospho-CoA kinase [Pseudomonadota bacterium]
MKPVFALTGGIGSGKSTVAARLEALGATVVDTDEISRHLTGPAGAAMAKLREEFGASFVATDGSLDRDAMRRLAFEDARVRARLEGILHPAIRAAADERLARAAGPYSLLVVPLLFETRGYLDRVARTLVVDCPEELQVARTMARSGLSEAQVRQIMATQWPRWRRLQMAGDVVWNGGSPGGLEPQCERIHREYARAAGNRP